MTTIRNAVWSSLMDDQGIFLLAFKQDEAVVNDSVSVEWYGAKRQSSGSAYW